MGYVVTIPSSLTPMAELKLLNGEAPTALRSHDWKTWVLEDEAVWQDSTHKVVVPAGFMTDFASIPWLFRWWQTGGTGPQRIAAYFHDYLYSSQDEINRKQSDWIFREVMEDVGRKTRRAAFRRNAMYLALRIGGWFAWRSGQKKFRDMGANWRTLNGF